jgi:ABC-2 type transport system permease protein
MFAILKKDLMAYFSSLMGWGTISSFFILMGIYVWVIDGNILDYGFAELTVFFDLTPWFLLFFVPALSMSSFSEETDKGTFQLLRSLPIRVNQILAAKYLALAMIVLITLLPSALFVQSIASLGFPTNNFDSSLIWGGFAALFLLTLCFVFLDVLASSFTKKQPVAFILGLALNFAMWQGSKELGLETANLYSHYDRMSMGVVNFGDLLYFSGFILVVWGITRWRLRFLI